MLGKSGEASGNSAFAFAEHSAAGSWLEQPWGRRLVLPYAEASKPARVQHAEPRAGGHAAVTITALADWRPAEERPQKDPSGVKQKLLPRSQMVPPPPQILTLKSHRPSVAVRGDRPLATKAALKRMVLLDLNQPGPMCPQEEARRSHGSERRHHGEEKGRHPGSTTLTSLQDCQHVTLCCPHHPSQAGRAGAELSAV